MAVVSGGRFRDDPGFFIEPTVLQVEDPRHVLMCDELFGPVLTVFVYDDKEWNAVLPLVDSTSRPSRRWRFPPRSWRPSRNSQAPDTASGGPAAQRPMSASSPCPPGAPSRPRL